MYTGYCYYTVSNADWGYDARQILHRCGGVRGHVKIPKESGNGYYRPFFAYLFKSADDYIRFKGALKESTLDWHVEIDKFRKLPADTVIIEED